MNSIPKPTPARLAMVLAFAALAACGAPPEPPQPPTPSVSVETVRTHSLSISNELSGRLVSPRTAEVRARVAGIVLERVYQEGGDVKKGDVLFRIDPAPLKADLESAEAAVRRAEATQHQANLQAQRYAVLVESKAVSRQDYENARAANLQAQADVAATRAVAKRARLNLDYSTVTAPISGRIGKALVTEGALVGQDSTTALAIIQQLEPIYADVTQSTRQIAELRRSLNDGLVGRIDPAKAQVSLIEDDGTEYPRLGKIRFTDLTVDPGTGQIVLRSEFPNPDKQLLPGSYVRVRVEQGQIENGITVAERAVQRDASGKAYVLVLDKNQATQQREIQLGNLLDNRWIVKQGLVPGDRVVVLGLQHAPAGTTVTPLELTAEAAPLEELK